MGGKCEERERKIHQHRQARKILSRFSPKISRTTGTAFSYYLDINLNSRKIISEFPEYFRVPLKKSPPRSIDKGNITKAF